MGQMKINIVGCGLAGITIANLLHKKHNVTIFETRNHIGGNCYDSNICGTLVHNYGPHSFHTDSDEVYNFLAQYANWTSFELRPKGNTQLGLISLPYSQKTIKELGRSLSQEEIIKYIYRDYSEKQWGVPFETIPSYITNRVPRTINDEDPTWHNGQKYQIIPKYGYTDMFLNMLGDIPVHLNCNNNKWKKYYYDLLIYTGKIDEYFNYCYGKLPYRSLNFEHQVTSKKMNTFIINQNTKEVPYTRIYDHSYFNINHKGLTIITKEYSKTCEDNDIPFYPISFQGSSLYEQYAKLAKNETKTIFIGRLATYCYLDMWQVVNQSIQKAKELN